MEDSKLFFYMSMGLGLVLGTFILSPKYTVLAFIINMLCFMYDVVEEKKTKRVNTTNREKAVADYLGFEKKLKFLMTLDKKMLVGIISVLTHVHKNNVNDLKDIVWALKNLK